MDPGPFPASRSWLLPALAALGVALVLVLAAALNAQRSLAALNEMADTRGRARAANLYAEHTLSLFKDVESGMRGYLLTGHDSHLEPYRAARTALPASYAALRAAVGEVRVDDFDWAALDGELARRLDIAERLVAQRRQRGRDGAAEQALLMEGKASMDAIRGYFAELDAGIGRRLAELDAAVERLRAEAYRSDWLTAGVAVALVLLATALLLRERQLRIRLADELQVINRTLDARVRERTAELSAARDRIAGFAGELERGIEAERRRLSREVHDQIGQVFSAIRMIVRGLPANALPADQAEVLEQAVDMGVATARRIAGELRPPLLDDLGLPAAVTHFAERLFAPAGIDCEVALAGGEALGEAESLAVFRILQEACSNILRHAGARRVAIRGGVDGNAYRIEVDDDGGGLGAAPARAGALGIVGMQERAALLGGTVRVEAAPGGGVRVGIAMPLPSPRVAGQNAGHDEAPAP